MPGRVFLKTPLAMIADTLSVPLELADPGPRLDAAPGEQVAVLVDSPRRLVEARWGMVMSGRVNARGRPVMETIVNARSETVFEKSAFQGVARAVLPVNGWYEWTGQKGRKTRWQISDPAQPVLWFAAIYDVWQGPGGIAVPQVATVTCPPNSDVEAIHHRMPVLLDVGDLGAWLSCDAVEAKALCRPAAEGRLAIAKSDLK